MKQDQIVMIHGINYEEMTIQLLEQVDLASMIGDRSKRVGLKPNLVTTGKASQGGVTHPEIVDGLLTYLQAHDFTNVVVMEGSWVGAKTMDACVGSGLLAICEKHKVPFIDLQKDKSHPVKAADMTVQVCDTVAKTDFLINLPVLKGHCQTCMTCALKNMKGLIPNTEKRRFHSLGLHKPISQLNTAIHQDFILVDNICGDVDFEEGGNPVTMNRIFCCLDPVLCDAFACQTLGLQYSDVPYLLMAEELGVGSTRITEQTVVKLNEGSAAASGRTSRRVKEVAPYIAPRDACSACYGMLVHALDKMDKIGELWGHQQKICIGQGYQGQGGEIGVGRCTKGCGCSLPGCPPTAAQMIDFLKEHWI